MQCFVRVAGGGGGVSPPNNKITPPAPKARPPPWLSFFFWGRPFASVCVLVVVVGFLCTSVLCC